MLGRVLDVREGPVRRARNHRDETLWPEPVSQDLIAVTRGLRPDPEGRLVSANGRAAEKLFSEPLGFKRPMVSDEHVNPIDSADVHVPGENLLQPRAPAHVITGDLMDGGGLGRDRRGRRDEVGSDEDDLPAYKIDSSDLHDGVVWGRAGRLQIYDSKAGRFVRGAGHALFRGRRLNRSAVD
jgi:hypothetical protein